MGALLWRLVVGGVVVVVTEELIVSSSSTHRGGGAQEARLFWASQPTGSRGENPPINPRTDQTSQVVLMKQKESE